MILMKLWLNYDLTWDPHYQEFFRKQKLISKKTRLKKPKRIWRFFSFRMRSYFLNRERNFKFLEIIFQGIFCLLWIKFIVALTQFEETEKKLWIVLKRKQLLDVTLSGSKKAEVQFRRELAHCNDELHQGLSLGYGVRF